MDSESSAFGASNTKHHRYMVFGKKQRYIEVFQCSGEDMSMVLAGGASGAGAGAAGKQAQPPLLSPGMLQPPVVSQQFDMLPLGALGVPQLGMTQVPQIARPDMNMLQLLQVQGLGLGVPGVPGVPPATPPLVMLPPRPIQPTFQLPGILPQQRYPSLLPTPGANLVQPVTANVGAKRSHEQAFTGLGGYTGSLPPKRPPVMYTSQPGAVGVGTPTPPGTPGLLPTPTTIYGTQAQPPANVAAAYQTLQ